MKEVWVWRDFDATEDDRYFWRKIRKLGILGNSVSDESDNKEYIEVKSADDLIPVEDSLKAKGYLPKEVIGSNSFQVKGILEIWINTQAII